MKLPRLFYPATLLSLSPALLVLALMLGGGMVGMKAPLPPIPGLAAFAENRALSTADAEIYRALFAAQAEGRMAEAEALQSHVHNKNLLGHVLAERYLHSPHRSQFSELQSWLAAYADLPQAEEIYRLALARRKPGDAAAPSPAARRALTGYGDNNGLAGSGVSSTWTAGLDAWEYRDYGAAYRHFTAAYSQAESRWNRAGSAYWAHRAAARLNDAAAAKLWLARAGEAPRTFYGILARKAAGHAVDATAIELPEPDQALRADPAVQRATALAEAGQHKLAERELRVLFPRAGHETRLQLIALAAELKLPAVQISMARHMGSSGAALDQALYPTPGWQPKGGYALNPSLIHAFARQESGFNTTAKSPVGALGLMQLMPGTAQAMKRRTGMSGTTQQTALDPEANLRLGQEYISYLLDIPAVSGNLIYLSVAYNAGPARLIQWKRELPTNDPLLFVERIPYGETRHYVQQVLANYWVYQSLEGVTPRSAGALTAGAWPRYEASGNFAQAE